MEMNKLILILTLFLTMPITRAENCAPVGNRATGMPVYDQGQTSMCYAFTATQMFDIWRKQNGEKVPPLSSPSDIAFRYTFKDSNSKSWEDVKDGSSVDCLRILFNEGGCPYYNNEDFNRDLFGERWDEFEELQKLRKEYFKQEERIDQGKEYSGLFSRKNPKQKQQELVEEFACKLIDEDKFPEEKKFFEDYLKKSLETGTTKKFFQKYFEKGCEKHRRLSTSGKLQSWGVSSLVNQKDNMQNLKNRLDKALVSGKSAPGISYCSNILSNARANDLRLGKDGIDCQREDAHVSIVVDRRPGKNGQCEYLIRNTWGTSCNSYPWPCQMGQIWIPENELLINTMSVLWVE
jgi:hypothetical protein